MLGLLRLLLRALLAIIPPGAGLIKMQVIGGSERLKRLCETERCVHLLHECYILAVNVCSVLIIAVLVYLLRSLVAFSPCSACSPMIYVLRYLLCRFSCSM